MLAFLSWYFIITLTGWLVFPLAYHLLPSLADRGYAVSRALGLILWGYILWLLASLQILQFTNGSIILSLALVSGLSLWALRSIDLIQFKTWFRSQRKYLIVVEVLFLVTFAGWSIVRAANPEASGTEKPMELAFINAILHSPTFPPHDPWLSGYAISYYHFGYILVSILAKLSQTSAGVAFNLGSALVFGMSAVGAYGLVFNLLQAASREQNSSEKPLQLHPTGNALFGPLLLLIASNLEGFLHSLHMRGLFWSKNSAGQWVSAFWNWLDINDLKLPPIEPFSWQPDRFWWWWRASRVIQDYDLSGAPKEIINEFPFFSFLLADLHPHVLTLPFALLAMTLALNILLGGANGRMRWLRVGKELQINSGNFLLLAVVLGGIAFLNTWDLPAHLALAAAALAVKPLLEHKKKFLSAAGDLIWFGGILGFSSVALYAPFYLSFTSQAGGVLPNLIYPTRGAQLWVMFAIFLAPLFGYMIYLISKSRRWYLLKNGVILTVGLFILLFSFALLLGYVITLVPQARGIYLGSLAAPDWASLLQAAFTRRVNNPGGWLTLGGFLILNLGILSQYFNKKIQTPGEENPKAVSAENARPSQVYVLLIICLGALLVTGPEFVYLRDQFGWRMNTIFKFYYQAWLLWSVGTAYAVIVLSIRLNKFWGVVFNSGISILLLMSLFYPVLGLWSKTNGFDPETWTLDSTAYLRQQAPDEMAAVDWLEAAPYGVVAEAVPAGGGSYTQSARVSMLTGKPAVLGWMGHESQWRGGSEAMGSRQNDLERLYCSRSWEETQPILEQYQIRYVFLSYLERSTYQPNNTNCPGGVMEAKFERNLTLVFQSGPVAIYEYSPATAIP